MNKVLEDHFFWKFVVRHTSIFSRDTNALFASVNMLVKLAYVVVLMMAFNHLFIVHDLANSKLVDPLWPLFFLKQEHLQVTTYILQISLVLSAILVIIKHTQFLRVYVFINYFLYAALLSSFGKINHSLHFILLLLFCFALIPGSTAKQFKEKSLLIFLSAKFFLLLAYSLTGFWKLFWGVIELFTQDVSLFSPLSFRNVLVFQFESKPMTAFGGWFLEHYVIGWLLYLLVIYLELFSILVFFKPNLYKIWGAGLIVLHLSLALILDVNTYPAVAVIAIVLLLSPFYKKSTIKETILSLPVIDWFIYLIKKRKA
ncbi:hypothetical protein [Psychroserpens algicola]|uniref:HTTM domain-containing protein n=1 Tax=Psychroserpens algicola TaxID=1719034 RepID=A0ABT0H6Y1_9FLAO|nr:hypothetical protein [Psychroserpens algicola]MCK8480116.1 hypothetical protein [Psychroserpens algicola]